MIATTIILGRALAPVESLIANWNTLVQARAAYARIQKLLESDARKESRIELPAPKGHLSVERVALAGRTPDRPIIRQVTLTLEAGESLAVVGPSASGKSSLARLIVGIWTPTHGSVRLDGADVGRIDRKQLGGYLGYLPQDVELFPATIGENIARLGELDSAAIVAAAQRARVHEMVLRMPHGYDTPIGEGGTILSGGQMQRIGLARALYGNPRLVVLDEPNANLDAEGEGNLHRIITELKRDGVTLVVITHKPSLLQHIDKVLVMREGTMEAFGPTREILSRITGEQAAVPSTPGTATGLQAAGENSI
jgi:PrtD family type I secretion system ABC transporter